jgi:hypothetical protein
MADSSFTKYKASSCNKIVSILAVSSESMPQHPILELTNSAHYLAFEICSIECWEFSRFFKAMQLLSSGLMCLEDVGSHCIELAVGGASKMKL